MLRAMLTIGRFADATGLTVKALRHYDEIGLLRPATVDPGNGYRYYDPTQVEAAVTIRRLRALELPLGEIAGLLNQDGETVRGLLAAHEGRVAGELHEKANLLIELGALVKGGDEEIAIEVRDEPELRLASMIRHLPVGDHEGVWDMVVLTWRRLEERGIEPEGPPTAIFRWGDMDGTHLVEVGYAVSADVEGDDLMPVRVYPAAAAVVAEHHGSYDDLDATAQRFIATTLGQGLRFGQPIRIEFVELHKFARLVWPLAP